MIENLILKRAKLNTSFIQQYIKGSDILDIGSAEGFNANCIKEVNQDLNITLLDVVDINMSEIQLVLYDGEKIPFEDNTFDTSLILLVLHHCEEPEQVLKEAIRVTKDRLIISESVYNNRLGKKALTILDYLYNSIRSKNLMPPALNFNKVSEWMSLFENNSLELKYKFWISQGIHKHIVFILDKD